MRALITIILVALYASNTPANECFDDRKLAALLAEVSSGEAHDSSRGALIYVWSPRMAYSVHNMEAAAHAAEASGLKFVALHDPRVPTSEMSTFPIAYQAMCSQRLMTSDALRHFPSAFVVNQRGIHRHPIVGAMPASAWASSIAHRLALP